jgi:protease I
MKTALLIIAQKGYQDVELEGTRDGLVAAGYKVVLASTKKGECVGKFDGRETAQIALKDVKVSDYGKVAFIGGPGMLQAWQDEEMKRIARATAEAGIPLGAICIAPKILASAEVLAGKKATLANGDGDQDGFLALHDCEYTGEPVTVDGRIVTANGPDAAVEFGKTLAAL